MDLYQTRLLTEGIRIIEKTSPSNNFKADYSTLSFEDALVKRTQLADLRYQISPVFKHLEKLLTLFLGLMCVLFFIIGASSVSQLLVSEQGTQINFFWALLLFIVPNIISLIIWSFLYIKPKFFNITWVTNLSLSLITLLDKLHHKVTTKHTHYIALFKYYFDHRFGVYMGRVQLSFISHIGWGSYLLGATLSVLLILATHQVDFIWQTTILNEGTFLWLTQLLTYLPNLFALNVPSPTDVSLASIDTINSLQTAQHIRISWSNLLIFSLIVYALLPRIIFILVFYQRVQVYKKRFNLNLSLSYYVQLKSLLHPIVDSSYIKDADLQNNVMTSSPSMPSKHYKQHLQMPQQAYSLAIELNAQHYQQAIWHVAEYYSPHLINALDSHTQVQAISELQFSQSDNVLLYVDVMRLPDRGWLSFVKKCRYKENLQLYLILLGNEASEENPVILKRLQGWMEAAMQININADHITYLIDDKSVVKSNNREKESKHG